MLVQHAILALAALQGVLSDVIIGSHQGEVASNACNKLKAKYPDITYSKLNPKYINANTEYYTSSAWLGPACVFEPSNSTQMSDAVQILEDLKSTFAIRGGGHMPIANAANIDSSGVLLSSFGLARISLSEDESTVNVGPGNRWSNIYDYLEPYELTVVGGRLGHVGVPGYIIGGGVSYFSNEYGWASANVASFTVVLADGKVAKVTADNEYSDLFWTLRGGSSLFALVTNFELKTIRAPKITIGMATYGSDVAKEFIDAVHSFTMEGSKDLKAATIPMAEYISALGKATYSAILFYNGVNENPAALKSFLGSDLKAFSTFPAVTERFITASTINGGDPRSLDVDGAPYIWVEESITSTGIVSDKDVDAFYENVNGQIVKNLQAAGIEMANFIYLNDANPSQDAFRTFPAENLERLKSIRAKYDPNRVFTDLMPGGFKVV
ncbi:hypothetical protein BBP40_010203 [Aspergillus hancockii]|nr:hypothetical protein BBP40_010203 [Aspergillus hancockii]